MEALETVEVQKEFNPFTDYLVKGSEIADEQRYDPDEIPTIQAYILGAQALLVGAGAFHKDNPMTGTVIRLIVGHWLENRDSLGEEHRNADYLPRALVGLINTLRFLPKKAVKSDEEGQS